LLASSVAGGAARRTLSKSDVLGSSDSTIASMTMSAREQASSRLASTTIRSPIAFVSSGARFSRSPMRTSFASIAVWALFASAGSTSNTWVSKPASAHTSAMPCPMVPRPSTDTTRGSFEAVIQSCNTLLL
jgi:hypothetical protein